MKKSMTIFGAIIFASFIFTSCGGGKSKSDKTTADSTKTEVKVEKPKSDSKEAIKAISEKYYIPVNESKSDLIFTINQNLNFELVNYKGSFEGKYVDGKVQFDDKNATIISFSLKGENVILKNQNDVEVEFKQATDQDLIVGTWYYTYSGARESCRMIFTKNGSWSVPDDPFGTRKGAYKCLGDKKYTVPKYSYDHTASVTMKGATSFFLVEANSENKFNHTRAQKGKLQSLNQIFN